MKESLAIHDLAVGPPLKVTFCFTAWPPVQAIIMAYHMQSVKYVTVYEKRDHSAQNVHWSYK